LGGAQPLMKRIVTAKTVKLVIHFVRFT